MIKPTKPDGGLQTNQQRSGHIPSPAGALFQLFQNPQGEEGVHRARGAS